MTFTPFDPELAKLVANLPQATSLESGRLFRADAVGLAGISCSGCGVARTRPQGVGRFWLKRMFRTRGSRHQQVT